MKIKVVSDITSQQSRNRVEQQFIAIGTEFEFFDAVTPDHSLDHIAGYRESEYAANCGRFASGTEIARYASHLALWRQCVREQVPYLILEDHAELGEMFLTGLLVATTQIKVLGFIHVSAPNLSTSVLMRQLGPLDICFFRHAPDSALGYAISPQVAEKLVHHGSVVRAPVDNYLQRFWHHRQPVFAIAPPVIHQRTQASTGDTASHTLPKPGMRLKLRRVARKANDSLARHSFAAAFLEKPEHFLTRSSRAEANANWTSNNHPQGSVPSKSVTGGRQRRNSPLRESQSAINLQMTNGTLTLGPD